MPTSSLDALIDDCLAGFQFQGEVLRAGTGEFTAAVGIARGNNNCSPSQPALVLLPTSASDVCAAVKCAAEGARRGLWGDSPPLSVCGGGHSELCIVNGGILLHMKLLDVVECHPNAEPAVVTAGGGANFGGIMEASCSHGLVVPTGTYPTVGIGAIVGGGVGRLTRSRGLACDNLVAAEIVLPNGSLRSLRADVAADAELLWAVRGCGQHFGVVVSCTLRAFQLHGARYGCGRSVVLSLAEGVAPSSASADDLAAAIPALRRAESAARALPPNQSVDMQLGWAPQHTCATSAARRDGYLQGTGTYLNTKIH